MAKLRERSIAKHYYVEVQKTAKEISDITGVSEQTLTKWINDPKDNWKDQRNAKLAKTEIRTDNIRQVINTLCDDRMNLNQSLKDCERNKDNVGMAVCRKEIARIDDSISKWNKTLSTIDKDNKITLGQYIYVQEEIFAALNLHDEKLYLQTIDFQEEHINKVAGQYR